MKISMIQMNVKLGDPEYNYAHAEELIRKAAEDGTDVIVLPETWNTGFFPTKGLAELADEHGTRTRECIGALAKEYKVNIVAGSVAAYRGTGEDASVANTAYIFNRKGEKVASYNKVHLFTHMGEEKYFKAGGKLCTFRLDDTRCGLVICYDLRFVEWVRKSALANHMELLFVVAQWPEVRRNHWKILNQARAIENQMYVAACNSVGTAGDVVYGGHSLMIDPLGEILAEGGSEEEILTIDVNMDGLDELREVIPVMRDRRTELY